MASLLIKEFKKHADVKILMQFVILLRFMVFVTFAQVFVLKKISDDNN